VVTERYQICNGLYAYIFGESLARSQAFEDKQGQQIADILLTHKFKNKLIFAPVNLGWVFFTKHHSRWLNLQMWFFNYNWNICKLWWMQAKSLGVACHQSRSWDDILYGFIVGGTSRHWRCKKKVHEVSIYSFDL